MTRYLIGLLVILLTVASGFALKYRGDEAIANAARDAAVTAKNAAEAERDSLKSVLATERESAASMSSIGDKHEQDRTEAERLPAAVTAGIGNGDIKLRKQWADCETARLSETVAGTIERDALAQLRAEDAGNLVRVGRDADDQVEACQAIVRGDRE